MKPRRNIPRAKRKFFTRGRCQFRLEPTRHGEYTLERARRLKTRSGRARLHFRTHEHPTRPAVRV